MNFCVIGIKWGKYYIKNLEFLGHNITAISSRNKSQVPEELTKYLYFSDYRVIDLNSIDTVCICTPPALHFEIAKYFITHRKHIIVEKPLVFTIDEAIELKKMALQYDVSFMVSYQYLWNKDYLRSTEFAKGVKSEIIIENASFGNVKRDDYSLLWDYSSHDLAMSFAVTGHHSEYDIQSLEVSPFGYSYTLLGKHCSIKNSFYLTNGPKLRRMKIITAERISEFTDNFKDNSMLSMFSEFIETIEKGERFTNIDLAIKVTDTLNRLHNFSLL